ncbi:MAG: copper chaperone PCu(A)C [Alphaproteobacteria bacterium]|nr:copper chaperone PCu(A)C [Alphaproteobacteria bacterium]
MRYISIFLSLLFLSSPTWAHEEKSEFLTISHPWSRATAPSQKVGAVFMKISTNGATVDRLIGAQSPDAEAAQIHGHTMVNDVMRMRPVDGVDIPSEGEAALAPGGFHIMLVGLKAPLFEETVIPLTLVFEKAGKVEIEAVIEAAGAGQAKTEDVMAKPAPTGHGGHGAGNKR